MILSNKRIKQYRKVCNRYSLCDVNHKENYDITYYVPGKWLVIVPRVLAVTEKLVQQIAPKMPILTKVAAITWKVFCLFNKAACLTQSQCVGLH